jgi:CRP/FNR family cyclic AMP-dependent transcriptional regulator
MSIKEEVEVLKAIPLFSKMEPAKLKLLAFTSQRLTFEAGQSLFAQGDPGDAAYIVLEGDADVSINTPQGPVTVATVGRHAILGEVAILCEVPRTATVTAKSRPTTLRIDKDLFFRLVNEFPQMAVEIMRELARRLEHTNEQLRAAVGRAGAA